MAVQIGKYKRPGIFIEEFDNSVITSPVVEGINTMVLGFSRKGPVNTPILLTNINDLEKIFGTLDRNLERKGSFFHRTVAKMLESSSVYAVNLLITDDTLDTIEYKSLSAATNYENDVIRTGPYRRFFDTTGFWKRDSESFLNLTKANQGYAQRALSFTNMSDKNISVFVFKTQVSGFDRTLIEWYGSVEKMPPYVRTQEYASDYMVDVVVVGGDWSNYQVLAVDPRWSQYFGTSGLRKDKVRDFANDRNVTLLAYYEGLSLIPYFRDANGRNIFIENIVNGDTDKTGLFCAFNADLFETDSPSGVIDLLGNNLVGLDAADIDFLSYGDSIVENIVLSNTPLDRVANVTSVGSEATYATYNQINRTGHYSEGMVSGVSRGTITATGTASISVSYTVSSNNYSVIDNVLVNSTTGTHTLTIDSSTYPTSGTASFKVAIVLEPTGDIVKVDTTTVGSKPVVGTSDLVLGWMDLTVDTGNDIIVAATFSDVYVDGSGYQHLTFGTASTNDVQVTDLGSGSFKYIFKNTANVPTVTNYEQYRKFKMFNKFVSLLDSPNRSKMAVAIDSQNKATLDTMTVTGIVTSNSSDKEFILNTGLTSGTGRLLTGSLTLYTLDDEFILSEYSLKTKNTPALVGGTNSTTSEGVVAKQSTFYKRFYDGIINTGDYFYENVITYTYDVTFTDVSGNDYVVFYNTQAGADTELLGSVLAGDKIILPESLSNKGTLTVTDVVNPASIGFIGSGYVAFQIAENTTYEVLLGAKYVYNYNEKHYLKMWLDSSNVLNVVFMDQDLIAEQPILTLTENSTISIKSQKSNFKQTVEIEEPSGYTPVPNKILVNGTRYGEVKVGDFLEAVVDTNNLQVGEYPRKITRVLSKRQYSGDTSLIEITCDAAIYKYDFSGDKQTYRYTTIDNYVSAYKAITMAGFRVRQDSMPDGTEVRQNQIMNMFAKGTSLFKALVNKDAIDFRYVVDSFGLGLTEKSKQQLVDLCGERLDAFGFISMPSMKSFKDSTSPSFVNSEGVLQMEYVAKGGDPESNPAFLYSFGEGKGVTTTGYFLPYVTVNDNGRPTHVPPAAYVATTYLRKHNSTNASITPWTISAGITNGRVTAIAGTEMTYSLTDIEFLNQAQMNPIVFKRNRGYMIETENTAQTLYKSALSYIHVREVLIELERELSAMLLDFQWKFNTPEIRAEIKLRADVICEKFVAKNGLYNFFNKIDEENNTQEIIDNQMGVLDTFVEPIKGMGIIVGNITVLRTGAIQAGGFILP